MNAPVPVTRGVRVLRRLLQEQTFDLRTLDVADFRRWLDRHLVHWQKEPAFAQRVRIRELRCSHPHLLALEQEHARAAAADAASPQFARLHRLELELTNTARAIAGLTAALDHAAPEKRPALKHKLEAFQAQQQSLSEEQAVLIRSSPQRQTLLQLAGELDQLRSAIGLEAEETLLARLLRQHGHRSGHAGEAFEQLALAVTNDRIVRDLLAGQAESVTAGRLRVLRGVTLGAARTEFDLMVIRSRGSAQPVEVLAVVEAKRNINDVAHGFQRRQENLAWLTGVPGGYDPEDYRTKNFRSGHFDQPASHLEEGETYLFDRTSFRRFHRDPATGQFLKRLYFVTRAGPLWGIGAADLGRINHRVATDEAWAPADEHYLRRLLGWCQSLTESVETADVLRLYAAHSRRARQILVLGEHHAF